MIFLYVVMSLVMLYVTIVSIFWNDLFYAVIFGAQHIFWTYMLAINS
jgi:hypothetical protein